MDYGCVGPRVFSPTYIHSLLQHFNLRAMIAYLPGDWAPFSDSMQNVRLYANNGCHSKYLFADFFQGKFIAVIFSAEYIPIVWFLDRGVAQQQCCCRNSKSARALRLSNLKPLSAFPHCLCGLICIKSARLLCLNGFPLDSVVRTGNVMFHRSSVTA